MSVPERQLEVPPERAARWVTGAQTRHGALGWTSPRPGVLRVSADDGFVADLAPLVPRALSPGSVGAVQVPGCVAQIDAWVGTDARLALLLVRRGGYAVGLARGPTLVAHKVGTRYVQSRTAAGGWSQQRYARRRANQADALVLAVREHAVRVLVDQRLEHWPGKPLEALVVGGDRALVGDVLDDPRLRLLTGLPRASLFDLPDPRLEVLHRALARGRAVRITLTDPMP